MALQRIIQQLSMGLLRNSRCNHQEVFYVMGEDIMASAEERRWNSRVGVGSLLLVL